MSPMLDVAFECLLDPMFAQTLTIIRRAQSISSGGLASDTDTTLNPIGVVTVGGLDYQLEYDAEVGRNLITVHCQIPLRSVAQGYEPDIVFWQGNNYTVRRSQNWSQYGSGFYAAEAIMLDTQTAIV